MSVFTRARALILILCLTNSFAVPAVMASTSGTSCPEQTGLGLAALTAHLNKKSFVDKLSTLEDAEVQFNTVLS